MGERQIQLTYRIKRLNHKLEIFASIVHPIATEIEIKDQQYQCLEKYTQTDIDS